MLGRELKTPVQWPVMVERALTGTWLGLTLVVITRETVEHKPGVRCAENDKTGPGACLVLEFLCFEM